MKINLTKILSAAVVTVFLFASCQPESLKDIGEIRDIPSSLAGNWALTKVVQKDEESARKGFPYAQQDLTTLFPYTDFNLTLNVNDKSPSTFTSTPGNSPKILTLSSGTWSVDDGENPTAIIFKSASGATETVTLGAYPVGGNTKLTFRIERRDADPAANNKLLISYTYEFTKK